MNAHMRTGHLMQVGQDLCMWCYHYELGLKWWSKALQHVNSSLKAKLKIQPAVGEVMCALFGIRKV